ncbi:MAG TPA: histidine kinase dimerization/phospho-acceptor domain-containing protein, partial [Casimicrobiaceae bacterium]|nr:histidine kinase dimerization/phospho-acceptor domain-containing protein [Casimicrobiaceae bacterium]
MRALRWLQWIHDPVSGLSPSGREELNQRLRLHRFLLASTFSMLYLVVLAIFHTQDKIDSTTLLIAVAIVLMLIATFFALFRLGLNLHFRDPSLTALQVLAAVFTMLLVVYRAPETRLVFAAFFFVALMFGMLRSSGTQLAVLGAISLGSFMLVALARYGRNHDVEMLRLDMLQIAVTALTFPWLLFIGSRVKRLKEADRRKDDFLATLAHELRNPLAPIRTGVQILRMAGAESQAQSVIPMMERQLQHLTRLLDDLLDVSRITRGKIALHLERIDLRQSLQAAVEANRPLIEQMGHKLAVSM